MGGRLKKGGLDRNTVSIERALQGIGALEEQVGGLSASIGSNKSFDYDVVTFSAIPGSPLELAPGIYQDTVRIAATNAVIASCETVNNLITWGISNGTLNVVAADPGCTIRFLVF